MRLGLLALMKKYPSEALENACEIALSHAEFRLRTIRQLLKRPGVKQEPLPFLDEHPIICPLDDYANIVAQSLARNAPSAPDGFLRHDSSVPWQEKTQDSRRAQPFYEAILNGGLRGLGHCSAHSHGRIRPFRDWHTWLSMNTMISGVLRFPLPHL